MYGFKKKYYELHPELFPCEMSVGYSLNGRGRLSKKSDYRLRRILIGKTVYRIRASFLLSYHRGETDKVWAGLFLLRFGVPFWALALVFGKYAMWWWYRLFISLSKNSIVGTTIRKPTLVPDDILVDEHHIRRAGKKAYVATTVGSGCFLGMEVTDTADTEGLEAAYGTFKNESLDLLPDYEPSTVNTDGWSATQKAWKNLFVRIKVVE